MEAAEGPAVYWRTEAKALSQKLDQSLIRTNTARDNEVKARSAAILFSEDADRLRASRETMKHRMWAVWSALEDGPVKQQLWELWTEF